MPTINLRMRRTLTIVAAHPAAWRSQLREQYVAQLNLMLKGYRLTTAEILYHMPDHPKLLQTFVWQELDLAPKYPVLWAVPEGGVKAPWGRVIELN